MARHFIIDIIYIYIYILGNGVQKWLRHYATIRKVASTRHYEVNEFYQFT
jgi:hypothetical protein